MSALREFKKAGRVARLRSMTSRQVARIRAATKRNSVVSDQCPFCERSFVTSLGVYSQHVNKCASKMRRKALPN